MKAFDAATDAAAADGAVGGRYGAVVGGNGAVAGGNDAVAGGNDAFDIGAVAMETDG